jgi:hypothetical protein
MDENCPASLKENIHVILGGTGPEKERLHGAHFYLANTPQFMKRLGLTGEFFSIGYSVIARHNGKDADHNLTEKNWLDLLDLTEKIKEPFAIQNIIYHSKKITPEQTALLDGHNSLPLPPVQGLDDSNIPQSR